MSADNVKPASLFRREAVEGIARDAQGQPFVACGVTMSVICAGGIALCTALLAFAFTTETTRKARVTGYLEPTAGLVKVRAGSSGRIATLGVADGDAVRRGDPLFVIDSDHAGERASAAVIAQLHARLARLDDELDAQTRIDDLAARDREARIAALDEETGQLDRELALQERRIAQKAKAAQRTRRLAKRGHLPAASVEPAESALLDARAHAEALRRERLRATNERDALQADARRAALDDSNRHSAMQRERDALAQAIAEREARERIVVDAPVDGMVSGLLVREGGRVGEGAPLLTLIPAGTQLEARLLVPSHAAGFIAPQQSVSLRYAAFPYQRFGTHAGHIEAVAETLLLPGEQSLPTALDEPVYIARVTLAAQSIAAYGKTLPLKAGMQLDADIALDRRRIIEWLFEPLLGLRSRLNADAHVAAHQPTQ